MAKLRVTRRGNIRRAEIGRGAALKPLDHSELRNSGGGMELDLGCLENMGVARPIVEEGLQRRGFIAPDPAPARPVRRAGEGSVLSDLKVHLNLIRRLCHPLLLYFDPVSTALVHNYSSE